MPSHHLALEINKRFDGEVELDERYFGGVRKGKRGRGAVVKQLSLALRTFRINLNAFLEDTMVLIRNTFICLSKNANLDLIMAHHLTS